MPHNSLQQLFAGDFKKFKPFYNSLSGLQIKNLHKILNNLDLISTMGSTLYHQLKAFLQPASEDLLLSVETPNKIISYTKSNGLRNLLKTDNINLDNHGVKFFKDSSAAMVKSVLNFVSLEYPDKASMLSFIDGQALGTTHVDQLLFWRHQTKDYSPDSTRDIFWSELENSQAYVKYLLATSTDLSKNYIYFSKDIGGKTISLQIVTKLEQLLNRLKDDKVRLFFNSLLPLQVKQLVEFLNNSPAFKNRKYFSIIIEQHLKVNSAAYFKMALENPQYASEVGTGNLDPDNVIHKVGLHYVLNNSTQAIDAQMNLLNSTQIWNLLQLLDQAEFTQAINNNEKYACLLGKIDLDGFFKDKRELALNILKGNCPPQYNKYAYELIKKALPLVQYGANKEFLHLLGESFTAFTNQNKLLIQYRFKQFTNINNKDEIKSMISGLEKIINKQVAPTSAEEFHLDHICYAPDNSDQLSKATIYVMSHDSLPDYWRFIALERLGVAEVDSEGQSGFEAKLRAEIKSGEEKVLCNKFRSYLIQFNDSFMKTAVPFDQFTTWRSGAVRFNDENIPLWDVFGQEIVEQAFGDQFRIDTRLLVTNKLILMFNEEQPNNKLLDSDKELIYCQFYMQEFVGSKSPSDAENKMRNEHRVDLNAKNDNNELRYPKFNAFVKYVLDFTRNLEKKITQPYDENDPETFNDAQKQLVLLAYNYVTIPGTALISSQFGAKYIGGNFKYEYSKSCIRGELQEVAVDKVLADDKYEQLFTPDKLSEAQKNAVIELVSKIEL